MRKGALAFDYDGTLAHAGSLSPAVRDALAHARNRGHPLILVTGRILQELRTVCPGVDALFDRIVAENGPLLAGPKGSRPLAPKIPDSLLEALVRRGLFVKRGQVILATLTVHEEAVAKAARELQLDCELIRNRESLMVLPKGTSKRTGLLAAFDELGCAAEEAIGFGDAENDAELLQTCGEGIAVGDAVPALKAMADRVLEGPNGDGVAAFLRTL